MSSLKNRLAKSFMRTARLVGPLVTKLFPKALLEPLKRSAVRFVNFHVAAANHLPFSREASPDGVNLIGPIFSATGLGQSCRLLASALEAAAVPLDIYAYNPVGGHTPPDDSWSGKVSKTISRNINIFHVNAQGLPQAYALLGRDVWDSRYNIAYWLWESEDFPPEWLNSLRLADEIWTPSDFSGAAVKKHTDKPVMTMPYPITNVPVDPRFDRAYFRLPEDVFLYLCVYDSASVSYRKNALGAAKAFKAAFGRGGGGKPGLVIKAGNASHGELSKLKSELAGFDNIFFIKEGLSRTAMNSLVNRCDAFVSLHRAEGFGLVCAEAMFLGKPVIATNWSANTEFMTPETSCLVDYLMITLDKDYGPFAKGTRWADPDVERAAGYMKRLFEDAGYRGEIGRRARERVKNTLSLKRASERVRGRIEEILG